MESPRQSSINEYARDLIHHKARQLIGKHGFTTSDYQDLKQDMTLDLLMRLKKFDPNKASLNTFAARVVNRRISNLIRYRQQGKRDYRREAWSLDESTKSGYFTRGDLVGQDECDQHAGKHTRSEFERIDLSLDVSIAISDLPPDLSRLCELLLTHSPTQAARKLGIPRSTLYEKGIARLRQAFEDRGLSVYL